MTAFVFSVHNDSWIYQDITDQGALHIEEPLLGVIREQRECSIGHKGAGRKGKNRQGNGELENCNKAVESKLGANVNWPVSSNRQDRLFYYHYRPRSEGDSALGSVRLSIHLFALSRLNHFTYDLHLLHGGRP